MSWKTAKLPTVDRRPGSCPRPTKARDADPVEVGQFDTMSSLACSLGLPLCGMLSGSSVTCTRAAGHDESKPDHPGTRHVATGGDSIAKAVWS